MTAEYLIPANIKTPQGEIQNTKYWMLNANPTSLVEGLFWFDSVNHIPKYYDGTSVKEYGKVYSAGTGITISAGNEISVASTVMLKTDLSIDTESSNYAEYDSSTGKISIKVYTNSTAITSASDIIVNASAIYNFVTNRLHNYISSSDKGAANGVASLGSDGKVPNSQLPSFVDDVVDAYIVSGATALSSGWLSATDGGSALTPETGKIYVILTSGTYLNKTYRWSGTTYVEISASPGNATESAAGIAEIATNTEVTTGTDDTRIVTPKKLADNYQGKLTASTGITLSSNTISVTDYAKILQNTATATNALTLLGDVNSSYSYSLNIGKGSLVSGSYGIAIGNTCLVGANCVSIGNEARSVGTYSTAIGDHALTGASTSSAIQIGYGSNSTANSLSVGFYNNSTTHYNWQLLDGTTGLIPDARISSNVKKLKYAANNPALTASGGVATWEITHGLGTDDVMLVVKDISTGEIIFPAWKITSGKVTIEFLTSANIAAGTYRAIIMG